MSLVPALAGRGRANGISGSAVHSLALVADSFHMVSHNTISLTGLPHTYPDTNYKMLQLNDVLSLCVGLWAVKVAHQKSSSKMYTYGVCNHQNLLTPDRKRSNSPAVATCGNIRGLGQWSLPSCSMPIHFPRGNTKNRRTANSLKSKTHPHSRMLWPPIQHPRPVSLP